MFEKLEKLISDAYANVIRYSMYKDGEIFEHERIATCPCSNCYSISKNFTATAIGLAYDMGILDVEDNIVDIFENELPEIYHKNLDLVKIKHLLTQTMGIAEGNLFENDRYTHDTDDFINFALSAEIPFIPGEKFVYSNSNFYLLSCIIEKVSKMRMDLFLRKHLFSKISITNFAWECCPKGHTMGATGLYLSTSDMLKLGILYLNKGVWLGDRILSEKWVNIATTKNSLNKNKPTGFSFWFNPEDTYSGNGAHGQSLYVYPSKNIVFAAHSFDDKNDISIIIRNFLDSSY